MIVHNVKEGEYIEDQECTDQLKKILKQEDSVEKHMELVQISTDDYMSWNILKQHLIAHRTQFNAQLSVCENALRSNPKSYQAWHHRKFMMQKFDEEAQMHLRKEDVLTAYLLSFDPRNFHCWNYRMQVIGKKAARDLFNYSYLHHNMDEDPVAIVYTDPLNLVGWEYLYVHRETRRMKNGMYIRIAEGQMEVVFEKPFAGELVIESMDERFLCRLDTPSMCLKRKINNVPSTLTVTINGVMMKFVQEEDDLELPKTILRLESECIGALQYILECSKDVEERKKAMEELVRIDPIRRAYYNSLNLKHFNVYVAAQ
ncbi:subunit alpha of protein prenyltransferase [Ordospora colligata]|uniref:Subunit alpha of protein prenyltransferase n=1 Tax=Ordospora colligata OC4 TaxID=1354746 RepID=A0A0B2UMV6_9MICR|nr:subunit alpha of protein prenyltransferase [Ordospora colligata OC4]KHN70265.1 subunit alpha of protein prenyltransferase [Ordospora colligata OC4]TBU19358.1 subunit alpha of protein prenyltransferase [Ordospora colligata]